MLRLSSRRCNSFYCCAVHILMDSLAASKISCPQSSRKNAASLLFSSVYCTQNEIYGTNVSMFKLVGHSPGSVQLSSAEVGL